MGISKLWSDWLVSKGLASRQSDSLLDWYIADALSDEVRSPVPPGAWERLRKAIGERKLVRGYGMWVLDETFRDPPEASPATLSSVQFERALRIYRSHQFAQLRWPGPSVWGSWSPVFFAHFSM